MTSLHLSSDVDADRGRFEAKGLTVAVLNASDPQSYAHRLYAELRRLDQLGVDVLIAEESEHSGMGLAINDRLRRATSVFSTGE